MTKIFHTVTPGMKLGVSKHLLDLPVDLLLIIYEAYLQVMPSSPCNCYGVPHDSEKLCLACFSWPLEYVSRDIRATFFQFLADRKWKMEIVGDEGQVRTDIPCPRRWLSVAPAHLQFTCHGFYKVSAVPQIWKSLLMLCSGLRKASSLRSLEIKVDLALPRPHQSPSVDIVEIDRAPLMVMILLLPFTMLCGIPRAKVTTLKGSVTKAILADGPILQNFLTSFRKRLHGTAHIAQHGIAEISRRLNDDTKFWTLWRDTEASCSMIVENLEA